MIKVIDNALPNDALHGAIVAAETSKSYGILHGAGASRDQFKYNWMFYSSTENIPFENEEMLELWSEVKKHVPSNTRLHRAYVNAHTYGVEDTIHQDDMELERGFTVIVYLCNFWYAQWGGMTAMYEGGDPTAMSVAAAIIPKNNRILIFDKTIPHMVTPLSRLFTGVRLTCMFKLELVEENGTQT